jgi:hypothetical protein
MAFGFIGEENWSTKIKSQTKDASLFSTLIYVILSNLSSVGQMPYNWEPTSPLCVNVEGTYHFNSN